jgi:hypothetical protein
MNRKKFFTSISLGAIGFAVYNSFPVKYFSKENKIFSQKIKVKVNPLAVSRKKVGGKNV